MPVKTSPRAMLVITADGDVLYKLCWSGQPCFGELSRMFREKPPMTLEDAHERTTDIVDAPVVALSKAGRIENGAYRDEPHDPKNPGDRARQTFTDWSVSPFGAGEQLALDITNELAMAKRAAEAPKKKW